MKLTSHHLKNGPCSSTFSFSVSVLAASVLSAPRESVPNAARPEVGVLMWESKTELRGRDSSMWEVRSRCLARGEYFTVRYFLPLAIKTRVWGRGEDLTL